MGNCKGCARTLPLNMRKSKFIASTEGSIFLDRYSLDYARCHGGFTNPRAKYPRGLLNFLDTSGCDADSVPPMSYEERETNGRYNYYATSCKLLSIPRLVLEISS